MRHGRGKVYSTIAKAEDTAGGFWSFDQKHGLFGKDYYEHDVFIGEFKGQSSELNGLPEGNGKLVMNVDGSVYEGTFRAGQFDGFGAMNLPSGESYSGGFQENKRHGEGVMIYNDNSKYIGSFKNGYKVCFIQL